MKKLICGFLAFLMFSSSALADCDFTTITKNADGSFNYPKEIHICVGQMKQDLSIAQQQNKKLSDALDLKDLAISKADQRADMWMGTSLKLEERVNTIDSMEKTNHWLYFGLGVITVFAAGYAASQVYRH